MFINKLTNEGRAEKTEFPPTNPAPEFHHFITPSDGRVGKVWEVRKKIIGEKKSTMEATAIKHPITNKLLVSRKEIKEATLDYCQRTLANNVPDYDKCLCV